MFDNFKRAILDLFLDKLLSPEQRWTIAGYLVGAAERYAAATATECIEDSLDQMDAEQPEVPKIVRMFAFLKGDKKGKKK